MCQYQQLYSDETTYVIRCNQCNHYQIFFLNVVLSLSGTEYKALLTHIDFQREQYAGYDSQEKSIVLATPVKGLHLALSPAELERLQCILETAEAEQQALELLGLFQA